MYETFWFRFSFPEIKCMAKVKSRNGQRGEMGSSAFNEVTKK
jgi:hypothetical protein